jgi:DNA repair photolyase
MIDILTNALLLSPIPLQYTGNYCSHKCVYCFANINNPKRKTDITKLNALFKNYHKRSDIASFFLRQKYPVLISNNIDPFSKSNQPFVNNLINTLQDIDVPVVLATRGGVGIEIMESMRPTVLYVSIPYDNDETRQKYEPSAPSIESRYQLIEYATKHGHKVIVSINPLNTTFAKKPVEIAKKAVKAGATSILINKLHLTPAQHANMTENEKNAMGQNLLDEARNKDFQDAWIQAAIKLNDYTSQNNINLIGFDNGGPQNNYQEFKDCYSNILPTIYDWFNWCAQNKKENDLIFFDEFYTFFADKLPNMEADLSKYIVNRYNIKDNTFYKKMDIRNILHILWEHPKANIGIAKHFPVFSYVKKQYSNKLDYWFDNEHNKVMIYTPSCYNCNESVVLGV